VTLRTAPIDPYSPLSGYYVTLAYEAVSPVVDLSRPGGGLGFQEGDRLWVTVERDEPFWRSVSITRERPPETEGRVSMRGRWMGWRAAIDGAGRLYIPEAKRERVAQLMREAQGRGLVDLRVGPDGFCSVLRLRVGGEVFGD
jgi:uncharacterized membrane-anchored protein